MCRLGMASMAPAQGRFGARTGQRHFERAGREGLRVLPGKCVHHLAPFFIIETAFHLKSLCPSFKQIHVGVKKDETAF